MDMLYLSDTEEDGLRDELAVEREPDIHCKGRKALMS